MIGLDITHMALFDSSHAERLRGAGRAGQAVAELADFFLEFHRQRYRFDGAPIHDAMAVAHVIDPTLVDDGELQHLDRDGLAVLRRADGRRPLERHRPAAQCATRASTSTPTGSSSCSSSGSPRSDEVFAIVAPHGDVDRFARAARRADRARWPLPPAATAVVVTPHNVHVEGHFAVVVSARVGDHAVDRQLALQLVDDIRAAGLPVVAVSYGGNDPSEAELPLDWGTEVPLAFVPAEQVVVVAPARDLPLEDHIRLGEVIARPEGGGADRERRPRARARPVRPIRLRPGGGRVRPAFPGAPRERR